MSSTSTGLSPVSDTNAAAVVSRLVHAWYRQRAGDILPRRFEAGLARVTIPRNARPSLRIRQMKLRWGSCTSRGTITLNPFVVQAPTSCIDYVIAHELTHVLVPNHSRRFEAHLDRLVPGWRERRQKLQSFSLLERESAPT